LLLHILHIRAMRLEVRMRDRPTRKRPHVNLPPVTFLAPINASFTCWLNYMSGKQHPAACPWNAAPGLTVFFHVISGNAVNTSV
jgi:hypothetical protein